mmetsp:Transcript_26240/g.54667  ORF Transcript_26240/g.54667 Transcript_26240/m.54667 type:complete len:720 (-) Transcript_26240:44-2203(-)
MLSLSAIPLRTARHAVGASSQLNSLLFSTSTATSTSPSRPPFDKILIANRGEIACRVIDTCKRMNVRTVAVYSEADKNARHVQMADEAYCIGGPEAKDSYLRSSAVLDVAIKSGAKALHPGYGFLSENAAFADECNERGVVFMGPPSSAIRDMGSKSNSKEIMIAAGVPCTPGYHGSNQDPKHLMEKADEVGYPVLIKAVMGGGGKGMRLVEKREDFLEMLESCKRESMNSFSDDAVLLERYLTAPRHVEVQIFGDSHGNAVHLHERDCSVQRRHQKVLEEAPAPGLSEELRREFGEAAVKAAKAVGYVGAGTVEFLMEGGTDEFFFCEMNTRLQVEHPVTEMVTGVDLVEWQLRVASGELLPELDQEKIKTKGHAIEARIYAENPARNFLPATGHLFHLSPPEGEGVRVETGVRQGDDVSVFYDPMISKLICYDKDRDSAIEKLLSSLKEYEVVGMPTNIPFVEKCAAHPAFREGGVTTGFLDIYADDVAIPEGKAASNISKGLAALTLAKEAVVGDGGYIGTGWRLNGRAEKVIKVKDDSGEEQSVTVWSNRDGSYDIQVAEDVVFERVTGEYDKEERQVKAVIDNKSFVASSVVSNEGGDRVVSLWSREAGKTFDGNGEYYASVTVEGHQAGGGGSSSGSGSVLSPMPGKIVSVNFGVGDEVKEGDIVMILEAMKMEHPLAAPVDGVLGSLGGAQGDLIQDGQQLFVVTAPGEEAA